MLSRKQADFLLDLSRLILWVGDYDFCGDEVFFTQGCAYHDSPHGPAPHMVGTLHQKRLAQDLNLFVNGRYITGAHPHWYTIGDKWKSLHPDNRWGGDFKKKDFNHFSRTHQGKA